MFNRDFWYSWFIGFVCGSWMTAFIAFITLAIFKEAICQ